MTVKLISYTKGNQTNLLEEVAYVARVSNPTNQNNMETAEKLIRYLIKHEHWSPLEMVNVCLEIETTRDIARQILRHRSFSFQEFCVEGNQLITFLSDNKIDEVKISDLYEKFQNTLDWNNSKNFVLVYDEKSKELFPTKIKEIFDTGIKPVFKMTLENGKNITCTENHKLLTFNGFKELKDISIDLDLIGTNFGITQHEGSVLLNSKQINVDSKYTVEYERIKSIEYVGLAQTYDMEVDHVNHNYVCQGIITHNSQRYADPTQLGFEIREARLQDNKNRQNSIEFDDEFLKKEWEQKQEMLVESIQSLYSWAIERGIAKEQARSILPEGITKSRMYMNGTLRSWIHYIQLRSGNGTQKEHRTIALECAKAISPIFPMISEFISE